MPKVYGRRVGLPALKVDSLPGPLGNLHGWYRRRFCLQDRLETMSVLIAGTVNDCPHTHLRSGFLDRTGFWSADGDDVRCADCGQLWVATLDADAYLQYGTAAPIKEHSQ